MAGTKILVNAAQSLARSGVAACVRNAGGEPRPLLHPRKLWRRPVCMYMRLEASDTMVASNIMQNSKLSGTLLCCAAKPPARGSRQALTMDIVEIGVFHQNRTTVQCQGAFSGNSHLSATSSVRNGICRRFKIYCMTTASGVSAAGLWFQHSQSAYSLLLCQFLGIRSRVHYWHS